jgi:head-tail adaptor
MFRPFRHRITIEKKIEQRGKLGDVEIEWRLVCQTWAEIRDNVITIRYQPDLLPGYRVAIGKSYFEIIGVQDIRPSRLVRLTVKEFSDRAKAVSPFALWR